MPGLLLMIIHCHSIGSVAKKAIDACFHTHTKKKQKQTPKKTKAPHKLDKLSN
jgi:hypothetical protein